MNNRHAHTHNYGVQGYAHSQVVPKVSTTAMSASMCLAAAAHSPGIGRQEVCSLQGSKNTYGELQAHTGRLHRICCAMLATDNDCQGGTVTCSYPQVSEVQYQCM